MSLNEASKKTLNAALLRWPHSLVTRAFLYLDYLSDYLAFRTAQKSDDRFSLSWQNRYPCINDKTTQTPFDPHYLYHPAWAARILAELQPALHIDVSSSLNFCSVVSAFLPVQFYDYRPAAIHLGNLECRQGDLMHLPFEDNSVESLSCMHVIEHIGLGRYGDPIDPRGDVKAIEELQRVLAPQGNLLFVAPIGKPQLRFNAHRIYSFDQIINYFASFRLREFALIPDNAIEVGLMRKATKEQADQQSYGCGCFWFEKQCARPA